MSARTERGGLAEDHRRRARHLFTVCTVSDPEKLDHPITCVTWEMADNYCKANDKRLPTEAEWEFATRGPDGRIYPWGDDPPTAEHLNACDAQCVAWGKAHKSRADRPGKGRRRICHDLASRQIPRRSLALRLRERSLKRLGNGSRTGTAITRLTRAKNLARPRHR